MYQLPIFRHPWHFTGVSYLISLSRGCGSLTRRKLEIIRYKTFTHIRGHKALIAAAGEANEWVLD